MIDEILDRDATAQAALIRAGEVTATELVEATITRIETRNPAINAVSATSFDAALARASEPLDGALAGVPFLVKELIAYPGLRHSMGSRLLAQNVAQQSTPYSERLDAAGLVVLGATTTSEFGLLGSTETLLDGQTLNPAATDHHLSGADFSWAEQVKDTQEKLLSAGGSSGGSAAAVAAKLVPMAHASDGGGSIRIPASMTGLFGFKPGRYRTVPSGPADMNGLLIDHCVSRSVRDSALLLSLTEGHPQGTDDAVGFVRSADKKRLRIGVYRETLLGSLPDPKALESLEKARTLCAELGHEVIDTQPPPIDGRAISDGFFLSAGAGIAQIAAMMDPLLGAPVGPQVLEPFTLELLAWFRAQPEGALELATTTLEKEGAAMRAYLESFDVVLCPTVPVAPWALGTLAPTLDRETLIARTETLAGYTPIHNIAGVPAMSVPLGPSDSAPIGAHFAASMGREATLLALAYELEEATTL